MICGTVTPTETASRTTASSSTFRPACCKAESRGLTTSVRRIAGFSRSPEIQSGRRARSARKLASP